MKLSHLNGLRALEATLRNGTFTAAADELGVTVAAIGQQIRGLEDYLGTKLFDRLPSGVKPTDEALAVATRLTIGFTKIEEVFNEIRSGRKDGRLTVTMSHFMLDDWLAERLPRFHARMPDVEVTFDTSEEYADLFNGEIDMAIRFSPEPGAEYAFDELYKGCFMPVCTPDFASQHSLTLGVKDLTGVPLFQLHDVTSDPAWIGWPDLLKRHNILKSDPGPTQQVSGYRVALIGGGLVICGLTESFNDLSDGRLVAPLGPDFVTHFSFGYRLVWPSGKTLKKPMRQFREWLLEENSDYKTKASELLGVKLQ